jgi:tetratricopeptide (TPR) repeat protein
VAAREAELGQRGSVFYELAVPEYAQHSLAVSGLLLTSRGAAATLTPAIDARLEPLLETPPTVSRRFTASDVVTAYFEVYPTGHDTSVSARVTDLDGREVFRAGAGRPERSAATATPGHLVEIPLADVVPGRYRLRIDARRAAGDPPTSQTLAFEVVPDRTAWSDVPVAPEGEALPGDSSIPAGRIDRLEAWLAAIDEHQPGTADAHALMVRLWPPPLLAELAADVAMLVRLVDDPGYPVLWLVDPARPGRPQRAPYSTGDEARLRALARTAAATCSRGRGRGDADPEGRPAGDEHCARNRLLKRGAVLHTDAAIRFRGELTAARTAGPSLRLQVRFNDGQQLAREEAPGHWELAQALLDNVAPRPQDDQTVRLWYLATCAYGQYYERHTRHEDRAIQLFPDDAELLFLAGSVHETFASSRMQALVRSMQLPWGATHGIESERSELREAEELFRRATDADPALLEARVRRGRVLQLLGRHEQAVRELERAVSALAAAGPDPDAELLRYYAEMFLGAAAEATGRHEASQAAYGRAASAFPGASAPQLALSQLALQADDRVAALDAARLALRPRAGQDRDDPWWRYHLVQGRRVDSWFARLHESLASEP